MIIQLDYKDVSDEQLQIYSPTDAGALLVDGLGDGIMISTSGLKTHLRFVIQQASELYKLVGFEYQKRNIFHALPVGERYLTFRKRQLRFAK